MNTLWLHLQAPFAAFRWLQAGVYRATSPVIPPSAAWGLLLNLAHIETRDTGADAVVTPIRAGAPPLCLAIGAVRMPERSVLYQQLHSYPVGNSGKELAPRTHGAKHWIAPVRREVLVGFDAVLGVRSDDGALLRRIQDGLHGRLDTPRYGLPFAGDNNLLFDRIDIIEAPRPACWYTPIDAPGTADTGDTAEIGDTGDTARPDSCRLTVAIDRDDTSRTRSVLFAPTERIAEPPAQAWLWCPRAPTAGQTGKTTKAGA